jgi:hypothetical protein
MACFLILLGFETAQPFRVLAASEAPPLSSPVPTNYRDLANEAVGALLRSFYAGRGLWRDCPESRCWVHNGDWGSDALSDTLYLRWRETGDPMVPGILSELAGSERTYPPPCRDGKRCRLWSDVPMWDSIAASREFEVSPSDRVALVKAKAAFWAVEGSKVYGVGACPRIRYQRPFGRGDHLKTLESDSNGIKAALLLFEQTRDRRYLAIARKRYAAVRHYFLDKHVPLYSVYVFDDGTHCRQMPHRYFASVNGNMIWIGLRLARVTGVETYRDQAIATAHAVATDLADPNGVFADLQAENDIEEPLVEAMLAVVPLPEGGFARRWILESAAAATSSRRADGTFGRFFDGPPPASNVTAWQTNGGVAVTIAAAYLAPSGGANVSAWRDAAFFRRDITHLPATVRFEGSGIALIGTLGEVCCQPGHARVLVDGRETTNGIGAWQNKSSSGKSFPDSVLFAWRWPVPGHHRVTLEPGAYDAKEGGSFVHLRGYAVLRER